MALGITQVRVAARPRVAIVSTGDEVVPPDQVPGPGQVRDVNTSTVAGLVMRAGGIPLPQGIVQDRFEDLLAAAQVGLDNADVLAFLPAHPSPRDHRWRGEPLPFMCWCTVCRPGKPTILGVWRQTGLGAAGNLGRDGRVIPCAGAEAIAR
jgi:molybdopterin molybdotransferase